LKGLFVDTHYIYEEMKVERIILLIAIVISLVLSITSLCRTYPSTLSLDYMGVIVGVLSILVVFLLGWNIYSVVDFDKKVKSMDYRVDGVVSRLNGEMKHLVKAYAAFLSAEDFNSKGDTPMAIELNMVAIEEAIKGNETEPIELALNALGNIYAFHLSRRIAPRILKSEKARYVSILYELSKEEHHNVDFDKLISMIDSA